MTETSVVPTAQLVEAVGALTRAACWEAAESLLASATATDATSVAMMSLAAADIAILRDYKLGEHGGEQAIDRAAEAVTAIDNAKFRWEVGMMRLRQRYLSQIVTADGDWTLGGEGRDPEVVADLELTAEWLIDTAPSPSNAGQANFYRGLIADNIRGDRPAAPKWYERALSLAEEQQDHNLIWEALRHLGDHDEDDAGDLPEARRKWEKAAWHAARAGSVMGVLAQQLQLARLALREGNEAASDTLAAEVARWADALGSVGDKRRAENIRAR
jgi:tetratricopeptide (TPR) repeat protein